MKSSDNIPQLLEDAGGVEEVHASSVVQIPQQSFYNFGGIFSSAGEWLQISINKGECFIEESVYEI